MAGALMGQLGALEDANIFVLSPPPVQGMGNSNGFKMMVQDKSGAGYKALEGATFAMMGAAAQQGPDEGGLQPVQHRLAAHRRRVDRDKA
jgi:multidrug efflux pump subunit AcrB